MRSPPDMAIIDPTESIQRTAALDRSLTTDSLPCSAPGSSDSDISDKENRNSMASASTPKGQDQQHTALIDDTAVSFTPRRTRQPPRAWERRPATPHLPRTERQKIWKRVPLQELGVEINMDQLISKREQRAQEDYVRAVKRIKVARGGIKPDLPAPEVSRGTKFTMENIEQGGSPKKKIRRQVEVDLEVDTHQDLNGSTESDIVDDNGADSAAPSSSSPPSSRGSSPTSHPGPDSASSEDEIQQDDISVKDDSQASVEDPRLKEPGKAESTRFEPISHSGRAMIDTINEDEQSLQRHAEISIDATKTDSPAEVSTECQKQDSVLETPSRSQLEQYEERPMVGTSQHAEDEQGEVGTVADVDDVPTLSSTIKADQSQSAQDQASEFTAPAETSEPSSTSFKEDEEQQDLIPDSTDSQDTMMVFQGYEQEDTAFLAEFLLRAKASKAAREALVPHKVERASDDSSKEDEDDGDSNSTNNVLLSDDIEDPESPTETVVSPNAATTTETAANTSPLRRSARRSAREPTRLPRSQNLPPVPQFGPVLPSQSTSLPSTIQLKRATGNEFIFNAKPQQTQAMVTRSNTRRNQGNAVSADIRLRQLQAEILEATSDSADQSSSQTSGVAISPSKKRKSNKQEQGVLAKKLKRNVTWHEELVRYREATPPPASPRPATSADFAAIEANAQAEALGLFDNESSHDLQDHSGDESSIDTTRVKARLRARDRDDDSKGTVRKLRKVNIGTVNGTPAPKLRTRSQTYTHVPALSSMLGEMKTETGSGSGPANATVSKPVTKLKLPGQSSSSAATSSSLSSSSSTTATAPSSASAIPLPSTSISAHNFPSSSSTSKSSSTSVKPSSRNKIQRKGHRKDG